LQRALVNILSNAVNYTPAEGSVIISSNYADEERMEIRIRDTGLGIDSSDLPHIFERFYRADKARTRAAGGTGLGLAITREIIARHHGTIKVDSTLGKGSTFAVFLPTKLSTAPTSVPASGSTTSPPGSNMMVDSTRT